VAAAYEAALQDLPEARRLEASGDIDATYVALVAMLER
jgi:hypothetical protein